MNEQSNSPKNFAFFSQPGIPKGLVILVMLLIFTHASALLMNQSAAYWLDSQYTSITFPFSFLLKGGPWIFLGVAGVYLLVNGLLLSRLNVTAGLFLAALLTLSHSLGLYTTALCGFYPIYEIHNSLGCYSSCTASLVVVSTLFGLTLFVAHLPERLVLWGKRFATPLVVFWILLMGYGISRSAFPPASPWKPIAAAHSPGPRTMAAIAYDSKRQRAVLFGGITNWDGHNWVYDNSTWEWDGQDWQEIDSPVSPAGREHHSMAYDEKNGKVMLFGGQNASGTLGDLWEWDGVTWHQLCPVCNPAARFGHKMVYDTSLQQIVIYGGQDGGTGFAEGWTWNGENWNFYTFDSSTPAVYNAPLIYDNKRERIISFMGDTWGGAWVWEAKTWHKLDPGIQPPARNEGTLVYDPVQDYSVLFGGIDSSKTWYNDTWILNGETWTKLNLPTSPPRRFRAASFYDPVRHSIILYGGEKRGSIYNDMWELVLPGENQP